MTNCFVTKVDPKLAGEIESDLVDKGFTISKPPYTFFSAKKTGVSCTFYQSGKFTVQGKDMKDFIIFYLEPEILKEFSFSNPKSAISQTQRIGCDEAGKGDFFGPLCCASFYYDPEQTDFLLSLGVADSKALSDTKIAFIADKLKKSCSYEIISLYPEKYNELYSKFKNLNLLLGWAHIKTMTLLSARTKCNQVLLDQFVKPPFMTNLLSRFDHKEIILTERTKGEEDIAVACASILARDAFVKGMHKLSEDYGLEIPKGSSKKVLITGKKFLSTYGRGTLSKVCKTHFKTYEELFI